MKYSIIGAGKSGIAAALLAKKLGHKVFLSEQKEADENQVLLNKAGVETEFDGNTERCFHNVDRIITSPGVPPAAWVLREAEKRSIPIISELEFAWQQIANPVVAITGTNGKTTTTALTAYIFQQAGIDAIACGNIGTPLSSVVEKIRSETVLIVEVSSFQLDRIQNFQPEVAIILNITPDHLGFHGSMEKYIEAKFKIFSNQNEKNFLFLNADDKQVSGGAAKSKATKAKFSMSPVDWGIYIKGGKILVKMPQQHKVEEIMLLEEIRLPGIHNAYNSMAAALAARAFEIRNEDIRDSLMSFSGVEHRLEFVRKFEDVDYINDSKATNVNASWFALTSYERSLIWIAGGRGDSNDYSLLDEPVSKNVKLIITIGEESENIFNHFCTQLRCFKEDSLEDAVQRARENAEPGDFILFSPACKSFDMFFNFEHRGDSFKEIVNSLL